MNPKLSTRENVKTALAALALVLCAQASAQEANPLSLWVMGSGPESDVSYLDTVLPMFTEETGVSVEYEFVPWGDAVERISTAVISGQGPDVTQVGTTRVPGFQATGGFAELTSDYGGSLPARDAFFFLRLANRRLRGESLLGTLVQRPPHPYLPQRPMGRSGLPGRP